MLTYLAFGIGVLSAVVVTAALLGDVVSGEHRLWPPDEETVTTQAYLVCSRSLLLSILVTGILDWHRGPLFWDPAAIAGACLVVGGFATTAKAGADLGEELTKGEVDELRTSGLYQYSRNPQNVGFFLTFGGMTLATGSLLVGVLAVGGMVWLILMSLLEEPWLTERYGEEYAEYCRRTPRFLGMRSVRRALEALG